jgi:DnaJ-class molecular chaperone
MYRFAILAVLAAGCSHSAPRDLRPLVAVAAKYCLMDTAKPAPPDSGACKACRGTGRLGDSRVSVECAACGGTGKIKCKDGTCPPTPTRR